MLSEEVTKSESIDEYVPEEMVNNTGSSLAGERPIHESELMRTITQFTDYTLPDRDNNFFEEKLAEDAAPGGPPPKYAFFSKHNKPMRIAALKEITIIIVILMSFILSVWGIYWGSMFKRDTRFGNLRVIVGVESNQTEPFSQAMIKASQDPRIAPFAGWTILPGLSEEEIIRLVHGQSYWGSIYITNDNISQDLQHAFENGESLNTTGLLRSYYETGRDMNTITAYIKPTLFEFGDVLQSYLQQDFYADMIQSLNDTQFTALRHTNLLTIPEVIYTDGAPVLSPVVNGPLQVGLIYIVIVTFFQIMWFTKLNAQVGKVVIGRDYIVFRMILSQIVYLFLSLAFACLNAAYQIPLNRAWKGGFGVLWMISYLTMSAVGGANENVALIVFCTFPPCFGFWLLFFVMANIAATFAPIELCPEVYRFTYAMPIKNAYELMKVLMFNTSRHNIGREFGILVAWIFLNNLLMPFCIFFFGYRMKKVAIAEKKAADAAQLKNKTEQV